MSEDTKSRVTFVAAVTLGVVLGSLNGWYCGKALGRAEQAKVDAAKPPVGKEVPKEKWYPVTQVAPFPACKTAGQYLQYNAATKDFTCTPPTPQPKKGNKRKAKVAIIGDNRGPCPDCCVQKGVFSECSYKIQMRDAPQPEVKPSTADRCWAKDEHENTVEVQCGAPRVYGQDVPMQEPSVQP